MKEGSFEQRLRRWWPRLSASGPRLRGEHEVVCVRYEQKGDYERIGEIGFRHGREIRIVKADELAEQVSLGAEFYVCQGGVKSPLIRGKSSKGLNFVQTDPDETTINNLSLLPDCVELERLERLERLDRQARVAVPRWWWLIPLALLALTAFFVIPHLLPISVKWDPVADITYPTPLGPDQLNATASMPGEFIYEPRAETELHPGREQVLRVTFHTEPLPSPWRQLAILSGLLALGSGLILACWAWRGCFVYRRLCQEEVEAPAPIQERIQRVEELRRDNDERTPREPTLWRPAAALALVILALVGVLWYYLAYPRTVQAQQTINVLCMPELGWSPLDDVTYPVTLTETQLNAVADVSGEFIYTPPAGTELRAGDGIPLEAVFVPDSPECTGGELYNSINVHKGTPTLEWSGPIVTPYGTPPREEQLKPETDVPGKWTFQFTAGPTPTVGTYDIVATLHPDDADNWNPASISAKHQVTKIAPILTWPQPAAITYPTKLDEKQLNAQANVPGTFTYSPVVGTELEVGERQLMVVFQPKDGTNYDSVTGGANLTVRHGDPGLRWSDPADIEFGTALGADQLNAWANVTGIFTYSPTTGTVLEVGDRQPLKVEFQPDNSNYEAASSTVYINVKPEDTPPPVPHRAQFLKNGDFEGGFTVVGDATAVGTHWRHFNSGGYHYGYYDDPWDQVWFNADHSQLIEIGGPEYDPGDRPNRLSGISQTVHGLISGQQYTMTLHGIIRVSEGDPDTDNLSYVVQWGVAHGARAAWQDVNTWNTVPWTHVFPYLSPGLVQFHKTTFTAQSDTLTLFIGLLKKPGKGNVELNLNLDGLSLTGLTFDPRLGPESK